MFRSATRVQQFEDDAVDIDPVTGVSVAPVVGVGLSRGGLLTVESDAMLYSGFGYTGSASLIRARLWVSRLGRTQDRRIQLWTGTELTGPNLADPTAEDRWIYQFTGPFAVTDQWGIVVDLGPHQTYPSSNTVYIRSVELEFV